MQEPAVIESLEKLVQTEFKSGERNSELSLHLLFLHRRSLGTMRYLRALLAASGQIATSGKCDDIQQLVKGLHDRGLMNSANSLRPI